MLQVADEGSEEADFWYCFYMFRIFSTQISTHVQIDRFGLHSGGVWVSQNGLWHGINA